MLLCLSFVLSSHFCCIVVAAAAVATAPTVVFFFAFFVYFVVFVGGGGGGVSAAFAAAAAVVVVLLFLLLLFFMPMSFLGLLIVGTCPLGVTSGDLCQQTILFSVIRDSWVQKEFCWEGAAIYINVY